MSNVALTKSNVARTQVTPQKCIFSSHLPKFRSVHKIDVNDVILCISEGQEWFDARTRSTYFSNKKELTKCLCRRKGIIHRSKGKQMNTTKESGEVASGGAGLIYFCQRSVVCKTPILVVIPKLLVSLPLKKNSS